MRFFFPQTVYCWGSILEKEELATLTGRAPELCGWALCPGSVARSCPPLVLLLSFSCPLSALTSPGHTDWLRPLTLWPGSVTGSCPPLVFSCPALLLSSLVAEQLAMSMPTEIIDEAVCSWVGKKSFLTNIGPYWSE